VKVDDEKSPFIRALETAYPELTKSHSQRTEEGFLAIVRDFELVYELRMEEFRRQFEEEMRRPLDGVNQVVMNFGVGVVNLGTKK